MVGLERSYGFWGTSFSVVLVEEGEDLSRFNLVSYLSIALLSELFDLLGDHGPELLIPVWLRGLKFERLNLFVVNYGDSFEVRRPLLPAGGAHHVFLIHWALFLGLWHVYHGI